MAAHTRRASAASSSAENLRQGGVNKYYQPWLDFEALSAVPADTGPSEESKRSLPDATFTAFAQLSALRLNVKRGMVSLIGTQTQTMLAPLLSQNRVIPSALTQSPIRNHVQAA
ncbi:hypothetical protein F4823DRAFT_635138 [Ustulina deusta]|nr:hypothetical protein F4823DRAFT_635138 [Ustulina deusta]